MKRSILTLVMVLLGGAASGAHATVFSSKHNLSLSGPGDLTVQDTDRVCIFCHARRNLAPQRGRWGNDESGINYIPYTSSTLVAAPGQPTGSSLLCLSCHDGTTALGVVETPQLNRSLRMAMRTIKRRGFDLTTDLSDDHPISIYYYDSYAGKPTEYIHPNELSTVVELDSSGQIQCISCHDAHEDPFGKFLRVDNSMGGLCLSCHVIDGWEGSAHKDVVALQTGDSGLEPGTGGCGICHTPHTAGGAHRLLIYQAEENNCLYCHNGEGEAADLEREMQKFDAHAVDQFDGIHDPAEPVIPEQRHVECTDCHDAHAARRSAGRVRSELEALHRGLPNALIGSSGVSAGGITITGVQGVRDEYEICLRCHGDSVEREPPIVSRWLVETNVRREFSPENSAYHPVFDRGRNSLVPSLVEPLTHESIIECTDCHNNDDIEGPSGPHGSIYPAILERQYQLQDATLESAEAYALCYKCHDRNSILANESFSSHGLHINGGTGSLAANGTSCSTCHDPHGSEQERLINFDVDTVSPTMDGRLEYFSNGVQSGGCYLNCHGVEHPPLCYDADGVTDC